MALFFAAENISEKTQIPLTLPDNPQQNHEEIESTFTQIDNTVRSYSPVRNTVLK